ncbi:hypothetical protein [Paenibacillus sp. NPDC058071]|uniref:hypothetical protein n=1 Tax=Paenibacillus sp. NPDC058071 TaxID=3346326 RepID=UPI0036D83CA8
MALQVKKALITSAGIEVEGDTYTCSLAIKEQWFMKVMDTGSIEADFYIDPGNRNEGVLSLSVGYEGCYRVEHIKVSEDEQARYFEQLEKMKSWLFDRKGKG